MVSQDNTCIIKNCDISKKPEFNESKFLNLIQVSVQKNPQNPIKSVNELQALLIDETNTDIPVQSDIIQKSIFYILAHYQNEKYPDFQKVT